ncbi:glycosyltransferase family 2 protein [Candidatus Bathyarchaeota archaeon]|nr:glycosyltransferase family 2 protein [Candidatus Bathyarchaeota archaeon]
MDEKPFIVACIPAYNEEKTIAKVVLQAMKYASKVVVCDDGSRDMTGEIAERLGAVIIRHERNLGKGAALRSLFEVGRKIGADVFVTLDADGQHDPCEIPRLIKPIIDGRADIVIGSRYVGEAVLEAPFYRRVGLRVVNFLIRKSTKKGAVKDTQSGFRAFTAEALERIGLFESEGFGVESELLVSALMKGLRVVEVPVTVRYRGLMNTSKRNPFSHGGEIVSVIIRMIVEERPLLYLGLPGALLLMVSVTLGTYMLWLFNASRYFSIPVALITLGAASSGIVLIIAALILYALNRVFKRMGR